MNIFIVGPMGSGKTTVGKIVAGELFLDFHDTDAKIEESTGVTIDWIFDIEGEAGFRKRETCYIKRNGSIKLHCSCYRWWHCY
jgi:shikimate kinase